MVVAAAVAVAMDRWVDHCDNYEDQNHRDRYYSHDVSFVVVVVVVVDEEEEEKVEDEDVNEEEEEEIAY